MRHNYLIHARRVLSTFFRCTFCLVSFQSYHFTSSFKRLGSPKHDKKWDAEEERLREVKVLSRSKWSDDLDDDNAQRTEARKGNLNALSGLIKAYTNEGKSVHWGDQVCVPYHISTLL